MADEEPHPTLHDDDAFELLERRLSDQVRTRVETTLKYRYGTIFAILLSVAAFFGYDFVERAREEVQSSLKELSEDVIAAQGDLAAFQKRVTELEQELTPLLEDFQDLKVDFSKLDSTFTEIEQETERVQDQLDGFIRKQTDIIAINFGNTLDPFDNETAGFYKAILEFADKQNYTTLAVFATVQLAINRAFNNEVQLARSLFNDAEEKARKVSNADYLNVLLQRASTESDQGLFTDALITLEVRAVSSLDGVDASLKGDVYQAIGNIYQNNLKFPSAIERYEKAAEYYKAAQNFDRLSRIQKTIGNIRVRRELPEVFDLEAAQTAYDEAVRVGQYNNDRLILFQSLSGLAKLMKEKGDMAEARRHACRAAEYATGAPVFGDRNRVVREFGDESQTTFEELCT